MSSSLRGPNLMCKMLQILCILIRYVHDTDLHSQGIKYLDQIIVEFLLFIQRNESNSGSWTFY